MYSYYNPNPYGRRVGDCTVRAISAALGQDWDTTYINLFIEGYIMKDMPNSNSVWDSYLKHNGFKRYTIPDTCTVEDFCKDHPEGIYVLGTGTHVVTCIDGTCRDAWDSLNELPTYYYRKEDNL